jgi:hypothetical protein
VRGCSGGTSKLHRGLAGGYRPEAVLSRVGSFRAGSVELGRVAGYRLQMTATSFLCWRGSFGR